MDLQYGRIGMFDSGMGGLTVLREVLAQLPGMDVAYLGDCARLPYGSKSPRTIIRYSMQCARFLVPKEIDILIVACNTASAHSIPALRAEFDIPVVGVIESGARAAVAAGARKVGVIATPSTIRSGAYGRALRALDGGVEVVGQACPLFVPLVEEGWCDDEVTEQVARRYLDGLLEQGIDTLLLGCTHYPLLKPLLQRVAGPEVTIVDTAQAAAACVARLVDGEPGDGGEVDYYLTDVSPGFTRLGELFLGREMSRIHEVDLGL